MSGIARPVHLALVNIRSLLFRIRAAASGGAIAAAAAAPLLADGPPIAAAIVDAVDAADDAGATPVKRVLLLPMGDIVLRGHGRAARLDDLAHAQAVVAASLAHAGRTDLMIDYDHQSFYAVGKEKGGTARAAGWIKGLEADDAGIWGNVEWTPAAAAMLAAREYRYISPLFYPAKDGRVAWLRNAGLVNEPAIESLPAVAAAANLENPVDYSQIAIALGLDAAASLDDILATIGTAAMPKAMAPMVAALGLAETASLDEIVAASVALAASAGTVDPAKFVPIEVFNDANARLKTLEGDRHAGIIAAATGVGKLTPAMAGWAAGYVAKDEDGFKAWLASAPVIVPPGEIVDGDPAAIAAAAAHGLTVSEIEVATRMGLTLETFSNAKKG